MNDGLQKSIKALLKIRKRIGISNRSKVRRCSEMPSAAIVLPTLCALHSACNESFTNGVKQVVQTPSMQFVPV